MARVYVLQEKLESSTRSQATTTRFFIQIATLNSNVASFSSIATSLNFRTTSRLYRKTSLYAISSTFSRSPWKQNNEWYGYDLASLSGGHKRLEESENLDNGKDTTIVHEHRFSRISSSRIGVSARRWWPQKWQWGHHLWAYEGVCSHNVSIGSNNVEHPT